MIFYFTGTVNSLYVAKTLDTEIVNIPKILNSAKLEFKADKIGIFCPVYGHEIPRNGKKIYC